MKENCILEKYLEAFSKMNRNSKRNAKRTFKAPHKPILLLSVASLIKNGTINENKILLDKILISEYNKFWNEIVGELEKELALSNESYPFECNVVLPIVHLDKTSSFWHLVKSEQWKERKYYKNDIEKLQQDYSYAYLDKELFALMKSEASRNSIEKCLQRMI
ncbi:MAG: hypothetical protein J6T86_02325 [Bacteroidales bacterium]|nr:hypothetical protein [Bacteroidales bacterium]